MSVGPYVCMYVCVCEYACLLICVYIVHIHVQTGMYLMCSPIHSSENAKQSEAGKVAASQTEQEASNHEP